MALSMTSVWLTTEVSVQSLWGEFSFVFHESVSTLVGNSRAKVEFEVPVEEEQACCWVCVFLSVNGC